jgi:transmembrane sensor
MINFSRVAKLIIKKKLDILTEDEKQSLYQLNNEYPFVKNIKLENLIDRVEAYNKINEKRAWTSILNKTKDRQKEPILLKNFKTWLKYAAAATIVLASSVIFFITRTSDDVNVFPAVVSNEIKIGSDKATLTLPDGSQVNLEKGINYQAKNAKSNGISLEYSKNNISGSEIAYNYLTIPRGGQFIVQLSDGTKVWLNSESKLRFPEGFKDGHDRNVELVYGEAYFDVSPSSDNGGSSFKVYTQSQEVSVLGTEFNIKAYKEDKYIYTTLAEGKVLVSNTVYKTELTPGQQSVLSLMDNNIIVANKDIYNATSWRKGVFSFKGMTLVEIMEVLGRWYDISAEFENEAMKSVKFNGVLNKNQNLEEILTAFKKTKYINNYEIKNRKVIIK